MSDLTGQHENGPSGPHEGPAVGRSDLPAAGPHHFMAQRPEDGGFSERTVGRDLQRAGGPERPSVLPFGKHKGKPINEVPRDYLVWLIGNATIQKPGLREEIEAYLGLPKGSTKNPANPTADRLGGHLGKGFGKPPVTVPCEPAPEDRARTPGKAPEDVQQDEPAPETARLVQSLQAARDDIRSLEAQVRTGRPTSPPCGARSPGSVPRLI